MVLLGTAGGGAVFDAVDGMVERMERRNAVQWLHIAGGMGCIGGSFDSGVPGKQCRTKDTTGAV